MTRPKIFTSIVLTALLTSAVFAQVSVDSGVITHDIDSGGPNAGGDFYGQGNNDDFAEFGATAFNFTSADFGGTVTAINSVELKLFVNDRTFSAGDMVEFFFTTDTIDDTTGQFFDSNFSPNGIDPAQFTFAPVSLGSFAVPEFAGRPGQDPDTGMPNMDTFELSTGSVNADLVAAINAGSDFQILIAAADNEHAITYSGVGNTFDPGDPQLTIDAVVVPEPASAILLVFGLAAMLVRRR